MSACVLCPRMCGVDRTAGNVGVCGQSSEIRIARAALHPFEEPSVSGTRGSGTVFFVGCSLRCVFCQNQSISRYAAAGKTVTPSELADIFLRLQEQGAHNVNLVTPTHFADGIASALTVSRPHLTIPVVYNTSGYERTETLQMLDGLVDVYMPDFKYVSSELSQKYSKAPNYAAVASQALTEMYRQVGRWETDGGLVKKGLLVRHLVLPGARKDSFAVLSHIAELLPVADIRISLMSQYTPDFASDTPYTELHRKVTSFEYQSVVDFALSLGFNGYIQKKSSASAVFTPEF